MKHINHLARGLDAFRYAMMALPLVCLICAKFMDAAIPAVGLSIFYVAVFFLLGYFSGRLRAFAASAGKWPKTRRRDFCAKARLFLFWVSGVCGVFLCASVVVAGKVVASFEKSSGEAYPWYCSAMIAYALVLLFGFPGLVAFRAARFSRADAE